MTLKNSDVRTFVIESRSQRSKSWLIGAAGALAIAVPALAVSVFQPQALSSVISSLGGQKIAANASVPVDEPDAAATGDADSMAGSDKPVKFEPIVLAMANARPAIAPPVDARAANDALARGLTLATRTSSLSIGRSASDYAETLSGAIDEKGKLRKTVNPGDIFALCARQAEGQTRGQTVPGKKFDAAAGMTMTGEILLCGMTRAASRLCEPTTKDRLLKQIVFYNDLRDGALHALANDKAGLNLALSALDMGVHRNVRNELRRLASAGVLNPRDFGPYPSAYINEAIGEYRGVKKACRN